MHFPPPLLSLLSLSLTLLTLPTLTTTSETADPPTVISINTHSNTCTRPSQPGDTINVHYRGTLASTGAEFDASYNRGQPLSFVVGKGQVIRGWDEGLLGMCVGDKRTLTIPPEFGYGEKGVGPIPGGSTLVFETELVGIEGVEAEEGGEQKGEL
ncbi:Peptidyl-prolyl cis-trans isomerase fpr2 [Bachmanniomyces sp. S44760]|nr:Peptidyl-prolyl cis-trans isomerase fpr2 [Bachmanniomyces sp. S44760]